MNHRPLTVTVTDRAGTRHTGILIETDSPVAVEIMTRRTPTMIETARFPAANVAEVVVR